MSPIFGRAWTPDEDAAIRADLERAGTKEMARRLGRTPNAVNLRASHIGATRLPAWTDIERQRLRNLWGELSLHRLAERVGHSTNATWNEASRLGLKSVPQGRELLTAASRRTGFHVRTLRAILSWHGVELLWPLRAPSKSHRYRVCVDSFEVDEAVRAWMATEDMATAARRIGRCPQWLEARLRGVEGVPPKPGGRGRRWRVPSEIIDRVVAGKARRAS